MKEKTNNCWSLTYGCAVHHHLFHLSTIIIEGQVPGAHIKVFHEARLLQSRHQQTSQRRVQNFDIPGILLNQLSSIQQLHKVKLENKDIQLCVSNLNCGKKNIAQIDSWIHALGTDRP